jgi:hypothetical protein
MDTTLVSFQVTTEEAAAAVPLKDCSATLTGYAVVVAKTTEMLTGAHSENLIIACGLVAASLLLFRKGK